MINISIPELDINQLEAVIDRLEAAISAREADSVRLFRIEAAANDALCALDTLLGEDR